MIEPEPDSLGYQTCRPVPDNGWSPKNVILLSSDIFFQSIILYIVNKLLNVVFNFEHDGEDCGVNYDARYVISSLAMVSVKTDIDKIRRLLNEVYF